MKKIVYHVMSKIVSNAVYVFCIVSCIGLLFFLFLSESVYASLMVEKHIFVQNTGNSRVQEMTIESVFAERLKKELEFTGVVSSGSHVKVFIRDKRNKKSRNVFEKGDMIRDMTIKEIGKNYVILANKKTTVRLNLFGANKKRPVPLKNVPPKVVNNAGGIVGTGYNSFSAMPSAESGGKPGEKSIKKRKKTVKSGSLKMNNGAGAAGGTTLSDKKAVNTFLEMIKKSQQQQKANPEFHNKFMELLKKAKQ